MTPLLTVSLREEIDVVQARQRAREIARLSGFSGQDQTRLATAVSEVARSCVKPGGQGRVEFRLAVDARHPALVVDVFDPRPGIVAPDQVRALTDTFTVTNEPGQGTRIRLTKHLVGPVEPARVAAALGRSAAVALPDELLTQNQELLESLAAVRAREQELQRLSSELEETNRGVVALYAELDEKAEALRQADQLKGRFLSHVSHEFRTPVNSILGLTSLLLRRLDGELTAEQEKQVSYIRQGAEGLLEMVNDLLDLAKVEAGKTDIQMQRIEVPQLFSALRGMMRPLAVNDAVVLVVEEPAGDLAMISDESKVNQILRNLVSNALKFTEHGEVRVSSEVVDGQVQITVSDTGIGIAPEHQDRIFQEFSQIHGPIQKKVRGTGLGLPLSRKLAQLLGGTLTVDSEVGAGSRFRLTLPVGIKPAEEPVEPANDTILVIDDEETSRYIIRNRLRGSRFRIIEASNGIEGAERARFEHPAMILLDLSMPVRSGFEVLDDLKGDPMTSGIPVVIHTSRALTTADYGRLGGRHAAILPKGADPPPSELQRIRNLLNEPDLFAEGD